MAIRLPPALKFLIRIIGFRIFLQVIHHGVAHRVGKGRLLPPQDFLRQDPILRKRLAQEIFALAVDVHLLFRIDRHHIFHKIQIPERHPSLQGVDGDAPVRPEHVVHMELPHPLFRFLLERFRAGGKVCIFVAEQLVRHLSGEQHPHIRLLVDGPAHQIHPDAGPDRGDIIGAQQMDHRL